MKYRILLLSFILIVSCSKKNSDNDYDSLKGIELTNIDNLIPTRQIKKPILLVYFDGTCSI